MNRVLLFIFFVICLLNVVKLDAIERGIVPEPVIFEVEVNAQCETYLARVLSTIQISKFNNPGCLPISPDDPTMDVNDRHSHVFCTNIGGGRSLFRFHEIFSIEEDETPIPGDIFIVSWVLDVPYIESTRRYTYLRRPTCAVKTDVCSLTQIVDYCNDNTVIPRNGFVNSSDRVYLIPPGATVNTCLSNTTCCPYVSTLVTGICGGTDLGDICAKLNCNDNNSCTTDTCDQASGCIHTPIVCSDNNSCTTDTCDPSSGCVFPAIVCDDKNVSTTDSCNPSSGCVFTPIICNDNNSCTNDYLNLTTVQCVFVPIVCNDNNACTSDVCNPTNGSCVYTLSVVCNDSNNCTTDSCNPTNGSCIYSPIVCDDQSVCTTDSCNPLNGSCVFTPIVCDDHINCTLNRCNATTGCFYPIKTCHDDNACTADFCDEANNGNCVRTTFCDDGISCTTDSCNDPCVGLPSPCPLDVSDNSKNTTFINTYCVFKDKCTPAGTCVKNFDCCSNVSGCGTGRRKHEFDLDF